MIKPDNREGLIDLAEGQHECVTVSLDVMDLDENLMFEILNALSVKKLNVSAESNTRQEDVDNWPYLPDVTVRRHLEIKMLISLSG
eukprot:gene12526-biopygen9988